MNPNYLLILIIFFFSIIFITLEKLKELNLTLTELDDMSVYEMY